VGFLALLLVRILLDPGSITVATLAGMTAGLIGLAVILDVRRSAWARGQDPRFGNGAGGPVQTEAPIFPIRTRLSSVVALIAGTIVGLVIGQVLGLVGALVGGATTAAVASLLWRNRAPIQIETGTVSRRRVLEGIITLSVPTASVVAVFLLLLGKA
jgi:hypothetical protein